MLQKNGNKKRKQKQEQNAEEKFIYFSFHYFNRNSNQSYQYYSFMKFSLCFFFRSVCALVVSLSWLSRRFARLKVTKKKRVKCELFLFNIIDQRSPDGTKSL